MSVSDEIQKLAELRDTGTLTQAEFERAKAHILDSGPQPISPPPEVPESGLRRSRDDRWIAGVCGGIGEFTGIEPWIWRLLFALAFLFAGFGILPYLLLWIFVPLER